MKYYRIWARSTLRFYKSSQTCILNALKYLTGSSQKRVSIIAREGRP